jgi:hypothetical protein
VTRSPQPADVNREPRTAKKDLMGVSDRHKNRAGQRATNLPKLPAKPQATDKQPVTRPASRVPRRASRRKKDLIGVSLCQFFQDTTQDANSKSPQNQFDVYRIRLDGVSLRVKTRDVTRDEIFPKSKDMKKLAKFIASYTLKNNRRPTLRKMCEVLDYDTCSQVSVLLRKMRGACKAVKADDVWRDAWKSRNYLRYRSLKLDRDHRACYKMRSSKQLFFLHSAERILR